MAHILVLDDQASMLSIISRMLRERGHDVEEAGNGEDGLKIFHSSGSFNLVVADVNMPKVNGFEFLKKVKADNPNLPVVLMTGMNEEVVNIIGEEYHVDAVIKKPFIVDEALDTIEKFSKIAAN